MKKNHRIIAFFLFLITILSITVTSYAAVNNDTLVIKNKSGSTEQIQAKDYSNILSSQEKEQLKIINGKIFESEGMYSIKKAGKLNDFINTVQQEYNKEKAVDMAWQMDKLNFWRLSPDETVASLETKAQAYLDKYHAGVKIGDDEFKKLVDYYMKDTTTPTAKKAREEYEFGALYCYMSLYEQNAQNDISISKQRILDNNLYDVKLQEICERSFDVDFENTISFTILEKYLKQNNLKSSAWPALNGWDIQSYARQYAIVSNPYYTYFSNGDCTNFVSQALYAGGLYQTSYVGEEYSEGVIDTTTRWFYFKNNTPTGYALSTSWIRVEDLYSYLAPHYATGENHDPNDMTNYLNIGFVLQGKRWWQFKYQHSVIITETNGATTYCGHSSERKDEPIQTFYDGFDRYRVIQTY